MCFFVYLRKATWKVVMEVGCVPYVTLFYESLHLPDTKREAVYESEGERQGQTKKAKMKRERASI